MHFEVELYLKDNKLTKSYCAVTKECLAYGEGKCAMSAALGAMRACGFADRCEVVLVKRGRRVRTWIVEIDGRNGFKEVEWKV